MLTSTVMLIYEIVDYKCRYENDSRLLWAQQSELFFDL